MEPREPHVQVVAVDLHPVTSAWRSQWMTAIGPVISCSYLDGEYAAFPVDDWKTGRVFVSPTKGGEARVVRETKTELLQPMGLAWSPDGRYVLFVERADAKSPDELWRVPVQGGQPEKLAYRRMDCTRRECSLTVRTLYLMPATWG